VYLLLYVFQPEVMTADKLFGAAAGYLMLGVLWAYFYMLLGFAIPNSFSTGGQPGTPDFFDSLYFSITVLTSTGFGDITPLTRPARSLVVVEQVVGALFIAILIARLAGVPGAAAQSERPHHSGRRLERDVVVQSSGFVLRSAALRAASPAPPPPPPPAPPGGTAAA
jgi:hypothetical protein